MLCEWGGDDRQAADALLDQVIAQRGTNQPFIRCENGGGFNSDEVIGITVPTAQQEPMPSPAPQ